LTANCSHAIERQLAAVVAANGKDLCRAMNHAHFPAAANWRSHINKCAVSTELSDWLTNRQSLTLRLTARCRQFRVQCLQQRVAPCLQDEGDAIGLTGRGVVRERNVLLHCDDIAVVYAHTVLPLLATAAQWPLFAGLGNKSLGSTLFDDPLVKRGNLQYAQLRYTHPLMRRILALQLVTAETTRLCARRSLFTRHGSSLLVTEVFLPTLSTVFQAPCEKTVP
jgi:chorismate--pyruvate lyase